MRQRNPEFHKAIKVRECSEAMAEVKKRSRPLCWSWMSLDPSALTPMAAGLRTRALLFGFHRAPDWLRHSRMETIRPGQKLRVSTVDDGLWFLAPADIHEGDEAESRCGDGKAAIREEDLLQLLIRLEARRLDVVKIAYLLAIAKSVRLREASLKSDLNAAMRRERIREAEDAKESVKALRRFLRRSTALYPHADRVAVVIDDLDRFIAEHQRVWLGPKKAQGRPKAGLKRPWIYAELRALDVGEESARDLLQAIDA